MKQTTKRARRIAILVGLTAIAITSASTVQAQSSEPVPPPDAAVEQAPLPGTEGTTITLEPGAVAEVARSRRISVAEATRRLEAEQRLTERVRDVERSLGGRTGGSYFDDSGALVLTTLDAAGDRAAAGIGARAQRVDDSAARLDDIIRSSIAWRHSVAAVVCGAGRWTCRATRSSSR